MEMEKGVIPDRIGMFCLCPMDTYIWMDTHI